MLQSSHVFCTPPFWLENGFELITFIKACDFCSKIGQVHEIGSLKKKFIRMKGKVNLGKRQPNLRIPER